MATLAARASHCSATFLAMYRFESPIIPMRRLSIIISSSFYRKHKNAAIVFGGGAGTMLQPYTLLVVRSGK